MYVGAADGVFKSTDGGENWKWSGAGMSVRSDPPGSSLFVYGLVIDPNTPSTIYAGTGWGVFKSINAGDRWDLVLRGYALAIALKPQASGALYAGGEFGLAETADGGGTWKTIRYTDSAYTQVSALAVDRGRLYVANQYGSPVVYRSDDGGVSWGGSSPGINASAITVDPNAAETLYASGFSGVVKSADGGRTWTKLADGFVRALAAAARPDGAIYYADTDYSSGVALRPCVHRSLDKGTTWTGVTHGLFIDPAQGCRLTALAAHPVNPGIVYTGGYLLTALALTRLAPDGALEYSTYLDEYGKPAFAVDPHGTVHLAGSSRLMTISPQVTRRRGQSDGLK
jgi:hypothetical protein